MLGSGSTIAAISPVADGDSCSKVSPATPPAMAMPAPASAPVIIDLFI
jgi:hypothetical protein